MYQYCQFLFEGYGFGVTVEEKYKKPALSLFYENGKRRKTVGTFTSEAHAQKFDHFVLTLFTDIFTAMDYYKEKAKAKENKGRPKGSKNKPKVPLDTYYATHETKEEEPDEQETE